MLLRGKTIFISEDNPVNRMTFQYSLMAHGARIVFERFGPNATALATMTSNLDLIVLDLMLMRGVTGYQLFEELRQISELDHVPIVAVSAAEPTQAMAKCQELGFSGFIPKPIDEQEFPIQLARILDGEELWLGH